MGLLLLSLGLSFGVTAIPFVTKFLAHLAASSPVFGGVFVHGARVFFWARLTGLINIDCLASLAGHSHNYINEPMPARSPERTMPWAECVLTMQGQPLLLLEDKIPGLRMIPQFLIVFATPKKLTHRQSWAEPFMSDLPQWLESSARIPERSGAPAALRHRGMNHCGIAAAS
ncbi:hypothetical protein B0H13DRAFT_1868323 [Mycena leptocephala]|nr:hypothetical protein B0H13DRAFT_1868323 [Mycena leptocephala]